MLNNDAEDAPEACKRGAIPLIKDPPGARRRTASVNAATNGDGLPGGGSGET